jgi:hypothetical protein
MFAISVNRRRLSAALSQEQHGDNAQRDEQADGGPVVEPLGWAGNARRSACSPVDLGGRLTMTLSHALK